MLPKVGEDPKSIPDAHTKYDCFPLSHALNDPSKVGELLVLNAMAEDTEEEQDLWPLVGPLYSMITLKSSELANC